MSLLVVKYSCFSGSFLISTCKPGKGSVMVLLGTMSQHFCKRKKVVYDDQTTLYTNPIDPQLTRSFGSGRCKMTTSSILFSAIRAQKSDKVDVEGNPDARYCRFSLAPSTLTALMRFSKSADLKLFEIHIISYKFHC